jgi:hypothetical protein
VEGEQRRRLNGPRRWPIAAGGAFAAMVITEDRVVCDGWPLAKPVSTSSARLAPRYSPKIDADLERSILMRPPHETAAEPLRRPFTGPKIAKVGIKPLDDFDTA